MNGGGTGGPEERGAASSAGYRARRSAVRRRRRRKTVVRLLSLLLVLVIVGGSVFAIVHFVGRGRGGTAQTVPPSSSTTHAAGDASSVLVAVSQDATTAALLYVDAAGTPTILMAFPGDTLVQAGSGFATVEELAVSQGLSSVRDAVGSLLGTAAGVVAELEWAALRDAAVAIGQGGSLPPSLDGESSATSVLTAAAALAAAAKTAKGEAALDGLEFGGDGAEMARAALRELPTPPAVQTVVPGKAVTGGDASYFEPDPERIAALLGKGGGLPTSVEVQNGSGEIGVAEAATEVISTLGFTMLEPKNAEQFPDVASTQIVAASDALAQAERVRSLLKVGKVVEQRDLPAGRIVVIIGKDLTAASLPARGE